MNKWGLPNFLCLDDTVYFYCDVDTIRLRETLWDKKNYSN